MAEVLTGTQRGHVITLDDEEPVPTAARGAQNGRRVRVVLEPLGEARLLETWAESGPQGPIEGPSSAAPEDAGLILSDEEQLRLLRAWAEEGPQGPIED